MECVNCQFFNIPTAQACGRCGTTLRFENLNITVEPPRAPKRGRWLRHFGFYWFFRGRDTARAIATEAGRGARPFFGEQIPPAQLFLRALVPGWSLRTAGAVTLGWAVLAVWGLLVLGALLTLGLPLSGVFLGLAFAAHYASGLYATRIAGFDRVYTFRVGAILAILLVAVVYVPLPLLFEQVVQPVRLNGEMGPFKPGDVLLYFPWRESSRDKARAGQWIMFELDHTTTRTIDPRNHVNVRLDEGMYLAKVLAVPGDTVAWDGQTLTINGVAADWQPSRLSKKKQEEVVAKGRYFVTPWVPDLIPYNNDRYGPGLAAGELNIADYPFHVEASQVRGRVFLKMHPLSELGRPK
jgi:hypothetical protein